MIFIPKPHSSAVRPISLANNFMKLFENILQSRLEWWAERFGVLPSCQSGFRRGRSCATSMLTLKTAIEDAFQLE